MKQIFKNALKGLLLIVLFTGGSIVLSTSGVKTVSEAKASVSAQQVTDYLVALGYRVNSVYPAKNSENWLAQTNYGGVNYLTTVYVSGNQIIGHTDVPM